MTTMPTTAPSTSLVTFTVKIGSEAIPETIGIVAIDLTRGVDRIPTLRLVVADGDAAKQDFEASSSDVFVPGGLIELEAGYELDERPIFKGVVTSQHIQVRASGGSRLIVEAKDPAFRMSIDRKSRYFADLTDADLFEELVGGYADLTADVEATTGTYPEIVQYRATDWDLLVTRAEKNGLLCLVEDGTVRVAAPDAGQDPVTSVAYGTGLLDFDLYLDARTQPSGVSASAWDQSSQSVLTAEVDDASAPAQGDLEGATLAEASATAPRALRHTGPLAQEELDAWALAEMTRARFARIRGTVRFQGTSAVKPGVVVEIGGVGERFNGNAFVSAVRHRIGDGNWTTTAEIGLDPALHHQRYPVDAPRAAGLHPGAVGLQIGVVTQLQTDPAGEHRIQVRLPLIDPDDAGVWSRLATLDAGETRGSFFLPEIGDEVVVGFLDDDPRHPVVLGMLNSSAKPAPLTASDDNPEKGFVTRSGMKFVFDDAATSVRIETPGGHRVVLDDTAGSVVVEDGGGSSITLDSSGITLQSARDITLDAASGTVSIQGLNVEIGASAALSAEGSASAALSSSGSTEVKGSIVQIN